MTELLSVNQHRYARRDLEGSKPSPGISIKPDITMISVSYQILLEVSQKVDFWPSCYHVWSPPPPAIQILYYHSNIKRQIVVHCCSYNWINSLTFELQNTFLVVGQDWSSDKINKESLAYILNYWCFSSLKFNLGGTLKGKYGPHIFHYTVGCSYSGQDSKLKLCC